MLSKATKLFSFILPGRWLVNHGPANDLLKQIFWKMENEIGEPEEFGIVVKITNGEESETPGKMYTTRQFTSLDQITSLVAAMAVEMKIQFPLMADSTENRAILHHTINRYCKKLKISRRNTYKIIFYIVEVHFLHTSTQSKSVSSRITWEAYWRKWYYEIMAPPKSK